MAFLRFMRLGVIITSVVLLLTQADPSPEDLLCPRCVDLIATRDGKRFGYTQIPELEEKIDPTTCMAKYCDTLVENRLQKPPTADLVDENLNIRITKAYGSKGYDMIRLTIISKDATPFHDMSFFDYSAPFKYVWKGRWMHTALLNLTHADDFMTTSFPALKNELAENAIRIPKAGEGVRGILMGDPCISPNDPTVKPMFNCANSKRWDLANRFPQLVNQFIGDDHTDFWGLLGDNFYDREGDVTDWIYSKLENRVKKKLFVSVLGNHDYWLQGAAIRGVPQDQCGNGFVQYYGLDMKSAKNLLPGDKDKSPYDLSIDPAANRPHNHGCNFVKSDNTFYYNSIGNVGVIGYSSVYPYHVQKNDFIEACNAFWKDESVDIVLVLGHWNKEQSGAQKSMAVPDLVAKLVTEIPSCTKLLHENRITFAMGHEHCNYPARRKVRIPANAIFGSTSEAISTSETSVNLLKQARQSLINEPFIEKIEGEFQVNEVPNEMKEVFSEGWETKEIPGFTLGSFGLDDFVCPDQAGTNHTFGIPVFDTTGGKFRVYYFLVHRGDEPPVVGPNGKITSRPELYYPWNSTTHQRQAFDGNISENQLNSAQMTKKIKPFLQDNFKPIMKCLKEKGSWIKCTHLAMLWYEQDLPPRRSEVIFA